MTCVHLRKLYQLCQDEGLRISSSYLIHFACDQCNVKEVCPSELVQLQESEEDAPDAADSMVRDHSSVD